MKTLAFIIACSLIGCASTQHNPIIKADTEDCKLVYHNIIEIVAKNTAVYPDDLHNNALRVMLDDQFRLAGEYDRFMNSCNRDMSVEQSICGSHAETLDTISGCMKLLPSAKQASR